MALIISYNINGIRAALKKDFANWLSIVNADIICLQEIKANRDQFDELVFSNLGYNLYCNSAEKKGYSGVAILAKKKPKHIEYGCGIDEIDCEGRIIRVDFEKFSVMSVYFPSGSSGETRQQFKMYFLSEFGKYIMKLKKQLPNLVISGDYNICHKSIDIHNPLRNKNTSGFLPEERLWVDGFLDLGFTDSFRKLNSNPNMYTWWSYRANSRSKNLGWRIDYHMISKTLENNLYRSEILSETYHSDHCPILLELNHID
ncbi:MAG: exodeoxyribonuclease III [Flavobacteriales bacterium]|nr:exodeoxyribonuclease III [Flavobacteriales bacterium]|tara:strand:+ start:1983 stop:2756 length:774 start_codon:yes stop_codon:yes gene_type:complete